jgi:hypothetical protein
MAASSDVLDRYTSNVLKHQCSQPASPESRVVNSTSKLIPQYRPEFLKFAAHTRTTPFYMWRVRSEAP